MRKLLLTFMAVFTALFAFADDVQVSWSAASDWNTDEQLSLIQNGIYVSAVKNNGQTAPTVNSTASDLRVYAKGTLTINAGDATMKKIVFHISAQGLKRQAQLTASTGEVAIDMGEKTVTWTGSAKSVDLIVGDKAEYGSDGASKAGQFDVDSPIEVICDGTPNSDGPSSGDDTGDDDPTDEPQDTIVAPSVAHITIAEFLEKADAETVYELTGTVTEIANTTYGNLYIKEGDAQIYIYGILDLEGASKNFASLNIAVGDELTVQGKYTTYKDAPQIANAQFVSVKKNPNTPVLIDPSNTAETAYTIAEVIDIIDKSKEYDLTKTVFVKGIVSKVDSYNSSYGSITYWISADGTEEGQQFEVYGGLNFEGSKFLSKDDLKPGDEVVVSGLVKKYNEIYEFDKNNVLVSLNGGTADEVVLTPSADVKAGSYLCAEALTVKLTSATEDTRILYSLDGSEPSIVYADSIQLKAGEYELMAVAQTVTGKKSSAMSVNISVSTVQATDIINGDMEAWTEGTPDGWSSITTASSAKLTESEDSRSGKSVLVGGQKGKNTRLASREIKVAAGWYTLSAYVKDATAGAVPAQARLGYVPMNLNANGSYSVGTYAYQGEYVVLDEMEYTKLSCTFEISEEQIISIVVMNHHPDETDVYDILVDDVEFRPATTEEVDILTNVDTVQAKNNGAVYNLQGQRVNAVQKGLYIQNGRVVVK